MGETINLCGQVFAEGSIPAISHRFTEKQSLKLVGETVTSVGKSPKEGYNYG